MAGRHVELREIDYAEVLRERSGGEAAVWDQVITNCLQGSAFELDEAGVRELLGIAGDSERLADLMATLEASGDSAGGIGAKTAALMRMLRGIVDAVSKDDPERLEPVLRNMAVGRRPVLARHAARADGPRATTTKGRGWCRRSSAG